MSSTSSPTQTSDNPPSASTNGGGSGVMDRVTNEAPAQAARLVDDAKTQVSEAARRSLAEVKTQAEDRTSKAAQSLRDLSMHVGALAAGRPDEAGNVADLAKNVGRRASEFADRLDADGLQGVIDDVSRYGRRHPWSFLGLALGAGFVVGRVARTTVAVAGDTAQPQPSTETSPNFDRSSERSAVPSTGATSAPLRVSP
jgi:hypothetical protein